MKKESVMFKRILTVFILAVGVLALRSGNVDAHLAGTVYKPTYKHVSSYRCFGTFAQVPNLDQHQALFECFSVVKAFEFLCANPTGKLTFGNSVRQVLQLGESFFSSEDLTDKEKGLAKKSVLLDDNLLGECDGLCKDRNRNWSCVDEFVTSVDVTLKTFDCDLDTNCANRSDQAFEALLHCDRPTCPNGKPCSLKGNPPPGTPGNPVETDYPCAVLEEAHCDQGEECPIVFP